jgi:predicted nucleotidyltransferase
MKYNQELIHKETNEIVNRFGREAIESVILTGSFARGENSANSDIEFLTVLKPRFLKGINKPLGLEKENISIGVTSRRHLTRFKPLIFTVETKYFGKVLWGDRRILDYIPNYSYKDIDPADGFVLLNNRIVEQLILYKKIMEGKTIHSYGINKGYIQLVNAYLTVNRRYRSLYCEKKEEFNRLYKANDILKSRINEAFDFLKNPDGQTLIGDEAMRQWWELRECFKVMWGDSTFLGTVPFRGQSLSCIYGNDIIKGWGKVLLNKKKRALFSFKETVENLFRTSPQFLIYEAAVHEYFSKSPDADNITRIIKRWEVVVK